MDRLKRKKISVLIPTYNEEANIREICASVKQKLLLFSDKYDYEIVIIDNYSKDDTRKYIRQLCADDNNIKAIFNARNFGPIRSPFYGLCQTTGDCTIHMAADFQDPPELIPKLIEEWENGYKIVTLVKTSSLENKFVYLIRSLYYKLVKAMSSTDTIEHFTGSGLFDKSFIDVLRDLDDSEPFLRGIVAELGFERKEITFTQPKRRAGKTSTNFFSLYDVAMVSITSYTKAGLRIATFFGFIVSFFSFLIGVYYFVLKLVKWDSFIDGIALLTVGMFFFGGAQLFFLGFIGEYIMSINRRVMHRPLVVEKERLNFSDTDTAVFGRAVSGK